MIVKAGEPQEMKKIAAMGMYIFGHGSMKMYHLSNPC